MVGYCTPRFYEMALNWYQGNGYEVQFQANWFYI